MQRIVTQISPKKVPDVFLEGYHRDESMLLDKTNLDAQAMKKQLQRMEAIRRQSRQLEKKLESALELIQKLREELANTKEEHKSRSQRQSSTESRQSCDRDLLLSIRSEVLTGRELLQNGQKCIMNQIDKERSVLQQMVEKLAISIKQQMGELRELRESKDLGTETATTYYSTQKQEQQQVLNLRNCIALLEQQIAKKDYLIGKSPNNIDKLQKEQTRERLRDQCYIDKTILRIDQMSLEIQLLRNELHFQNIERMRVERQNEQLLARLRTKEKYAIKRQLDDIHREESKRLSSMLCDLAINIERY